MKERNLVKEKTYVKKRNVKWYVIFIFLCLYIGLLLNMNLAKASEVEKPYATKIILNIKEERLNIGDSFKLAVEIQYSDGTKIDGKESQETIKYQSSDSSIASVNSKGEIKAKAPGEVTIRVSNGDGTIKKTCKITVKRPYLTYKEIELYEEEIYWLYVKNGNGTITWKSSNPSVVKVSSKGKLTGVGKGTATITAIRSGITMKCKVTVKKVSISASKLSLYEGQTSKLKLERTQKDILWSSSNKKIVTVSQAGKVTAKKAGKAVITATVGKKSYTCTITVKSSNLIVSKSSMTLQTKGKQSITVTYGSAWKSLVMEVSDSSVAKISLTNKKKQNAQLVILPKKAGTTVVKLYGKNEPKDVKTINITVSKTAISEKPNFTVTMSKDTLKSTKYGTMQIQNHGTKKLIIQSVAYSYDFDYSGYDRTMNLVQASTYKRLDQQSISAGKTADVIFEMEGKKTWYDRKTKFYFYIKYDGLCYEVVTSEFLGTTISLQ